MRPVLVFLLLLGCSKRNQEVCCETADECVEIGTKEVVACRVGVCVEHECVERGACDGNEDCELPETCMDGTCMSPPPPDAALKPAFDVVYPSEFRSSVNDPVMFSMVFVNTDVSPLSMTTLQVRQLTDDHPTAFVRIVTTPSSANIAPGFAGGSVDSVAATFFFDSGLVTEPRTDPNSIYATIEFVDAPNGLYDIAVDAVLGLDGLDVPLHVTIHREPKPTIFREVEAAARTQIFQSR
jgi:hypothetical protein